MQSLGCYKTFRRMKKDSIFYQNFQRHEMAERLYTHLHLWQYALLADE